MGDKRKDGQEFVRFVDAKFEDAGEELGWDTVDERVAREQV